MADSLIAAIEQYEADSELYGSLADDRVQAIEYYLGEPKGNEVRGRSQVVSRDVFDTVEWVKPDLAEIFCGGDEVVAFTPRGPEDVKGAQQETDFVNYIITQRNNWFEIFYGWSHDALLQKTGYVKAYWDGSDDRARETYANLSDVEYAKLADDPEVEVIQAEEYDELLQTEQGPVPVKCYRSVVAERVRPVDVTRVVNVAPENVRVAHGARGLSLQDPALPFCEHRERKAISLLRAEGFDVPDDISDGADGAGEYEGSQRNENDPMREIDGPAADPAMREVLVREVWIRYDENDDGIAELRHVFMVGKTILTYKDDGKPANEEVEFVNLVALCPAPLPHQHHGLSLFNAMKDLEDIKTALLRNALDNQYLANNGRYAIDEDNVNLDDMLESRPGGVVRVTGNPSQAILPLTHPTSGTVAIPMLEYVDKIGMKRTGINEQTQGLDSNSINKNTPYATTAALMSAAQKRLRFIARIFAETGVRNLFQVVHAITLKNSRRQEIVRLRNDWVPIDPRQWARRSDMQITVGLGAGDKAQQMAFYEKVIQMQGMVAPRGLANEATVYNALADFTRASGRKDVDRYWIDPSRQPPKPPQPPPEVLKEQAKGQVQLQIEDKRQEGQLRQHQADLEVQAQNDARDAERERQQAHDQMQLERWKAMLEEHSKQQDRQWEMRMEAMRLENQRLIAAMRPPAPPQGAAHGQV